MTRGTLIVNFKNYSEILGRRSLDLASAAEAVSKKTGVQVIVAPPAPMLYAVARAVTIRVYGQSVDARGPGKSTGAMVPESLKKSGCSGSLLNHSEARVAPRLVGPIIGAMKSLGLSTCLCAESPREIKKFAGLGPEYLAIEPPELIGTGVAVSRAKPRVIERSVSEARRSGFTGKILCGAGIVSGEDVAAARRAGAQGILVSSSVVKARDWKKTIRELAEPLL